MAAATVTKNYNITVHVAIKRTKDDLDFAKTETEKLHSLISGGAEAEWAKTRIEALHQLIFMPPVAPIEKALLERLKKADADTED